MTPRPTTTPFPVLAVVLVVLSLGLAATGASLGTYAVSRKSTQVRRGWTLVPAVVAASDIPAGATLRPTDLELRNLPEQLLTDSAFRDPHALEGKRVRFALPKGTLIPAGALDGRWSCP